MKSLFGDLPLKIVGFAVILIVVILLVVTVEILLVPFVAALFVAYLLEPGIVVMQRRGMERGNAYLILLTACLAAVGTILMFAPSWLRIESIAGSPENFSARITLQLTEMEQWVDAKVPMISSINIADEIIRRTETVAGQFFTALPALLTSLMLNLLLVPVIAYFMVRDGRSLKRKIVKLVPNRYFEMVLIVFHKIDQQIGGYLRGRLIECMLVTATQILLTGIATLFVPQTQVLLISVVCGITNLIPYVGPLLGLAFGALLYLGSGLSLPSVLSLIIVVAVAHLIDNILIAPAVLSHNVNLHPLTVVLVLVIGGELLGVLGLLIAIPVAASMKVIVQEFYHNYQIQVR